MTTMAHRSGSEKKAAKQQRRPGYVLVEEELSLAGVVEGLIGAVADIVKIIRRYQGVIYTMTFIGIVLAALLTQ